MDTDQDDMQPLDGWPYGRVVVRASGASFFGLVYHADDSAGKPSIVIAIPVGNDLSAFEALALLTGEADGAAVLDFIVDRIGRFGADVLPYTDDMRGRQN